MLHPARLSVFCLVVLKVGKPWKLLIWWKHSTGQEQLEEQI